MLPSILVVHIMSPICTVGRSCQVHKYTCQFRHARAIPQHAHRGPPRKPPKNSPKHRHTSTNPHSQRAAASPARRHLEDHLEENHEELQVVLNAPANDEPKTKSTREAETCSTERRTPAQEQWVARHGKAQPAVSATCISSSISKPQSPPRT